MSNQYPLKYLPRPIDLLKHIENVSWAWRLAGITPANHKKGRISLPVQGGTISIKVIQNGYRLVFMSFPHENVVLEQDKDSLSWIVRKGSKKSIRNAVQMTEIFFMNSDTLYNYVHKAMSHRGIVPKSEFTIETLENIFG